jgi:hypothetical protein
MRGPPIVLRLLLFVLLAFGFPLSSHSGIVGPDEAGYSADDSVPFDFQDISGTGLNVGAADETTHGPFPLGFSFRLYGAERSHVFLSSNGWLSFSDPGVPGGADASNDCPLPNSSGQDNLIAGIWDDLDPTAPGGGIFYQAFAVGECPYEEYPGACFIAQWNDVVHFANPEGSGTDDLTFEIVLFDNDAILIQIEDAGDEGGSGSTTGIENSVGSIGLEYACNTPDSVTDGLAVSIRRDPIVHYVNDDVIGGASDGTSWTNAFTDLQSALAVAATGEQIWVAEGVYVPGESPTDIFTLMNGVEIFGGFEAAPGMEGVFDLRDPEKFVTVLSGDLEGNDTSSIIGQNTDHVVTGSGTNRSAVLDGFTVTGGQAISNDPDPFATAGGGLLCVEGSPTLVNLVFAENLSESFGGGAFVVQGSPLFRNVTFMGNVAAEASGGGLAIDGGNRDDSNAELENVLFTDNATVGSGAGLSLFAKADARLSHVTFLDNSAPVNGGGMFCSSSDPVLTDVLFLGNSAASWGGGMYNSNQSAPILVNVVFSGCAASEGGAMLNNESHPVMTNVTFAGNTADNEGGALWNEASSAPILQNSILWGNTAGNRGDQIHNEASAFSISTSLIEGSGGSGAGWDSILGVDGGGNLDGDPLFVDADGPDNMVGTLDDDLRLLMGSPAFNAGDNEADLDGSGPGEATIGDIPTDFGGDPRIIAGIVDMGAFESPPPAPILYVNDDANGEDSGLNWMDAFNDLQSAIVLSVSGTQIWVAEGVYVPGGAESDTFRLKNGVRFYGGFEGIPGTEDDFSARNPETFLTILSGDIGGDDITDSKAVVTDPANIVGQNSDHIVNGSEVDATAVLDGFTITAGQADGEGLEDAVGGGAFIFQGSPTLANLAFSGNTAVAGGGVVITNDSFPALTDVTVIANSATAGSGGGLFVAARSDPVLRNFRILGNTAADGGGGMYNFNDSRPRLVNGIVSGNIALGQYGGGMLNEESSPNLTNVSFGGNNSGQAGGGMFNTAGSSPTIQNSIFWGNMGGVSIRGIFNDEPEDSPVITNCILEGGCDEFVDTCADAIDMDPLFVDPNGADNEPGTLDDDLRLMTGSPAINSGSNTADLDGFGGNSTTIGDIPFDLDGLFRIAEGTVDMGPYEFGSAGPSPTPTITSTPTQTSTPTDTPTITNTPVATETHTLTETVTATPTFAPTSSATPSPIVTRNYDVQPQPVVDGQINSLDLLHWFGEIKEGNETGDLLFDFSRFWQESP